MKSIRTYAVFATIALFGLTTTASAQSKGDTTHPQKTQSLPLEKKLVDTSHLQPAPEPFFVITAQDVNTLYTYLTSLPYKDSKPAIDFLQTHLQSPQQSKNQ